MLHFEKVWQLELWTYRIWLMMVMQIAWKTPMQRKVTAQTGVKSLSCEAVIRRKVLLPAVKNTMKSNMNPMTVRTNWKVMTVRQKQRNS